MANGEARREILLAEDEPAIREGLKTLLEGEGYAVRTASDGEEALAAFRARKPDLLLLDVMMPKQNGYAVCREVRKVDTATPILFLTAKDDEADELRGMSLGGDDYVSKTASEPMLLAHIAALLRRTGGVAEVVFGFGDWRVDAASCRLVSVDGARVDVSLREVELLRWFASHPGEVFSRDALESRFWGVEFLGGEGSLSMAIGRLRAKLGASGALIESVYGVGYRYSPRG